MQNDNGHKSREASIFRTAGPCITSAECDCHRYDGMSVSDGAPMPPLHEGCTCYLQTPEQAELRRVYEAYRAELSAELRTIVEETEKLIAADKEGEFPPGPLLPLFKAVAGVLISIGKIETVRPPFLLARVSDGKLDEAAAERIRGYLGSIGQGCSIKAVVEDEGDR